MIPSPKTRWQRTPDSKFHADLVLQEPFRRALDFALLEMVYQQVSGKEEYADASTALRISGARQFISILLELSDVPKQRKTTTTENLQHNL